MHSLKVRAAQLKKNIQTVQTEMDATTQQITALSTVVNSPAFIQMMTEQKRLSSESAEAGQQFNKMEPLFISATNLPKLTEDILSQQIPDVSLVSIKNFPAAPWSLTGASLPTSSLYQHTLQVEFHSNYFGAIRYLSRLEKLPWHLYWDSLEYNVMKYPEADVIVKFHVLSNQQSVS